MKMRAEKNEICNGNGNGNFEIWRQMDTFTSCEKDSRIDAEVKRYKLARITGQMGYI